MEGVKMNNLILTTMIVFAVNGYSQDMSKASQNAVITVSKESVKNEYDCVEKKTCEKKLSELEAENEFLVKEIEKLRKKLATTKTKTNTVYVKAPPEIKTEIKTETKTIVKYRDMFPTGSIKLYLGYGQNGLETEPQRVDHVHYAQTYETILAGLGYTWFFRDNLGLGITAFSNKSIMINGDYLLYN
jgi:cell division protein FtsB